MDLEELKAMTPSELQHYGIKGMRWGVRRTPPPGGTITDKLRGRSKQKALESRRVAKEQTGSSAGTSGTRAGSVKRELDNVRRLRNMDGKSDAEVRREADRVRNENRLRELAKGKEYRQRANMSDQQLKQRVDRLQQEDNLKREIKNSILTKDRKKVVNQLINSGSDMALSKFTNVDGDFSATGDPVADTAIKAMLQQTRQGNLVK